MLLPIADIFENSSLLYFKFTKISNPLPSPSSKNLLKIQKLVTISRKIFSKESAGREISLCNARISSYPSLHVIPAYGRYPTVGQAKIVQLVPFPKVVHPARWAALGGVKYTRGRGAISVIPSRQILGYRTWAFEGPCAFRRPFPLLQESPRGGGGRIERNESADRSFSIQAMPAQGRNPPVPSLCGIIEKFDGRSCMK